MDRWIKFMKETLNMKNKFKYSKNKIKNTTMK